MKIKTLKRKSIPFDFVLDYLVPLNVTVKQFFGLWAIYVDDKIMLILKQSADYNDTNGVWVATSQSHHLSLKNDLPSLHSISTYSTGIKESEWQMLSAEAEEFETSVRKACEFIKHNDKRIGRIVKHHQSKTKKTNKPGKPVH